MVDLLQLKQEELEALVAVEEATIGPTLVAEDRTEGLAVWDTRLVVLVREQPHALSATPTENCTPVAGVAETDTMEMIIEILELVALAVVEMGDMQVIQRKAGTDPPAERPAWAGEAVEELRIMAVAQKSLMALPAALASSSFGFHPQHNRHKRRSVSGRFFMPGNGGTYGNCRKRFTVFVW